MKKRKFNRNKEWPFAVVRGRRWGVVRDDNDEVFMLWLVHRLRKIGGRPLAEGERFNALALSLNAANLDYLAMHCSGGAYLAWAPREDNSLRDDELGVDVDAIYVKEMK